MGERAGADVQGLRFVRRVPAVGQVPAVMEITLLTSLGERDVYIVCSVPTARIDRWRRACIQLVNGLRLTR